MIDVKIDGKDRIRGIKMNTPIITISSVRTVDTAGTVNTVVVVRFGELIWRRFIDTAGTDTEFCINLISKRVLDPTQFDAYDVYKKFTLRSVPISRRYRIHTFIRDTHEYTHVHPVRKNKKYAPNTSTNTSTTKLYGDPDLKVITITKEHSSITCMYFVHNHPSACSACSAW